MYDFIKINEIEIIKNYIVKITFSDNSYFLYNFEDYIQKGNIFEELKNKDTFNKLKISEDKRSLLFPNNIDFCADSLWLKSRESIN